MTLAVCHRATCDAPRCSASAFSPHAARAEVREQLRALGWTLFSWRVPPIDPVDGRDRGGAVRIYYVCPKHGRWRPSRGVECPVRRLPEAKR